MHFITVLVAYFFDYIFAELEKIKFFKHPIIFMGNYIKWFEKNFYKDSITRGVTLTLSLLSIVFIITYFLSLFDNILVQGFLCSFAISSKMLYDSVKEVVHSTDPRHAISMLVSRDTKDMSESDINKAAVETYAENLSDGVIAPMFYILLFGLIGGFIYKAINTLDSMVGYKNERYENFGKFSAKLDDVVNYIPSRITAILIALFFNSFNALKNFYSYGKLHDSPNAGHPISAMALALGIKLGGPTSYFGKVKDKAYFGEGREEILKEDVLNALNFKSKFDSLLLLMTIIFFLLV
ncbi:cobalamin biosynthesis protein CobD [Arcobacter nitrofigilis DSM 7299]|uniref:Cobalamin biosynthesis protein CobD n=1 Tax=Arcobacter nitrofigilis (strain ATCC 33309 / DSM 7299 / CCUG 15893 / LMG 7604 / NCTC 12251 / CI) TaxID=572480 RepID=D5V1R4_ARCNC|nr:adenosylcobinamide-phosphate synthase CbiB [Arcobacter nitrofigilis]ADG93498.1 cobalamin biosynthesis protein CobD [Arcobacter nitrofigilis DSM 7299]